MTWVGIDDHLLGDDMPLSPATMSQLARNAVDDAVDRTRGAGHGFTAETGRRPDISTPTTQWREIAVFVVPWHVGIDTVYYRTRYELARGAESPGEDAMYARLVVEGSPGTEAVLQTTSSAATLELSAPSPVSMIFNRPFIGYLRVALQIRSIRGDDPISTLTLREIQQGGYMLLDVDTGSTPAGGRSHYEIAIASAGSLNSVVTSRFHAYATISIAVSPVDVAMWIWPHVQPGTVLADRVKNFASIALYDVGAITLHGRGAIWTGGGLTPIAGRGARDCQPGSAVRNLDRYNDDMRAIMTERGRWWGHGPRGDLGATSYTVGYLLRDTATGDDRILDAWTAEVRTGGAGARVALVAGIPYGTVVTDFGSVPLAGRDVVFTVEARVYADDGALLTTVERTARPNGGGVMVPQQYIDGEGSILQYNITGVSAANSGAGDAMGEDEHLSIQVVREQPLPVTLVEVDIPWDDDLSAGDRVRIVLICTQGTIYVLTTACMEIVE